MPELSDPVGAGQTDLAPPSTPGPQPAPALPRAIVVLFTVLVAITPAMPLIPVGSIGIDVTDLPSLAAALIGVFAVLRYRLWRGLSARLAPEAWALAAMVPFTLMAAIHAGSTHSFASGPVRWALNATLVAVAYALIRSRDDGLRMVRSIVIVATAEALFGLIAYALHYTGPGGYIGISFTGGTIGGMPVWGRITGTTGMASTFIAGFFALALPVAVGLAMWARGRPRTWWILASVIVFLGLVYTLSRVSIGLGTLAVVVLLLATTRVRIWLPILVIGAITFLATPLRARMTDFSTDRVPLWRVGWRMFTDNWFFGVGPGNYMTYMPMYQDAADPAAPVTPHNSLLYVASESGALAAIALAIAIGFSLRFLGTRNPLVLGPMLGVLAFMLNAMTTNLYSIASMALACWMMAPAAAAIRRNAATRRRTVANGASADPTADGDSTSKPPRHHRERSAHRKAHP